MRKSFVLLATGLLALGMAGIANAATLNWEGTFVLDMVHLGRGEARGGGVATVNSSGGGVPAHINTLRLAGSRGHVTGSSFDIVTDPTQAGNGIGAVAFEGIQGGTGTFYPISGGAASTTNLTQHIMPIYGLSKVCLLNTSCTTVLTLPFTGPTTVNGVPGTGIQGLGIGGRLTMGGYGGIRMSFEHAPWTIKTVTGIDQITTTGGSRIFIDMVQKGWAHAAVSTTSSTAQVGGMVQLVTPNQVQTNLPLGSNDQVGSTAFFVMRFIPEPGLLILVGSGIAGLALLGRGRMRH